MGVHVKQCNCPIVEDLYKIFEVYWAIGNNADLPVVWPKSLATHYNLTIPLEIAMGRNQTANISLSVSTAGCL